MTHRPHRTCTGRKVSRETRFSAWRMCVPPRRTTNRIASSICETRCNRAARRPSRSATLIYRYIDTPAVIIAPLYNRVINHDTGSRCTRARLALKSRARCKRRCIARRTDFSKQPAAVGKMVNRRADVATARVSFLRVSRPRRIDNY